MPQGVIGIGICEGGLAGRSHWWRPLHAWGSTLPDAIIQRTQQTMWSAEGRMLDAVIPAWVVAELCGALSDWFHDPFFRVEPSIPYPPLACNIANQ
jgi:hypothetical protein